MIDSLVEAVARARQAEAFRAFDLARGGYGLVTLHRPSNVDDPEHLRRLLAALGDDRAICRWSSRSTPGRARSWTPTTWCGAAT